MNAEEIAMQAVAEIVHPDAQQVLTGAVNVAARHIVNNLRKSGLLLEWRTDFENAPRDGQVLVMFREPRILSFAEWYEDEQLWMTQAYGHPLPTSEFSAFAIIQPPEQTND